MPDDESAASALYYLADSASLAVARKDQAQAYRPGCYDQVKEHSPGLRRSLAAMVTGHARQYARALATARTRAKDGSS